MRTKDFEVSIVINKEVVDFNKVRLGHAQFHVVNSKMLFPTGQVSLIDLYGEFEQKIKLGDGLSFTFNIDHFDWKIRQSFNMRIFRYRVVPHGKSAKMFVFTLAFNAPRWIYENASGAKTGTSTAVMKKLAEECGLKFEGDTTNDDMAWVPAGQKRSVFARYVEQRGYASDRSCMKCCLDLDGTLRYRDVAKSLTKDPVQLNFLADGNYVPPVNGAGIIPVEGFKEIIRSGLNNAQTGYGYETVEQGKDSNKVHSKVDVQAESTLVNGPINKSIEGSNVKFAPINSGNTFSNYEKAQHNNKRVWNVMNSLTVQVLTKYPTRAKVLDPVNLVVKEIQNNEAVLQEKLNGRYLINGHTVFVSPAMEYFEKFEFIRHGYSKSKTNDKQAK